MMRLWTFFFALSLWADNQPKVADLAWISGHWEGSLGSSAIHEVWTAPREGNMAGVFRMMRGGKVGLYELLTLEDTANGPLMRLRHFDAVMKTREAQPHEFVLVEHAAGRAKFRADEGGGVVTTLVYRATESGLAVDFEKTGGARPERVTFVFRRKPL